MKEMIVRLLLVLCIGLLDFALFAAPVSWTGLSVYTLETAEGRVYQTGGSIYSSEGTADLRGFLYCHYEEGVLHSKAYSYEGTGLPVQNSWILAYYGQVLGPATIESATLIELFGGNEWSGGTIIEDPNDFYLGFTASVKGVEDGTTWYGWAHLSIDGAGTIQLLASGIDLTGGPVVVGGGAIPEPDTVVLLFCGIGILGLKRKKLNGHSQGR